MRLPNVNRTKEETEAMSWDSEDNTFLVVINHEEQYSIWPDYKEIPKGWRAEGIQGKKQECLDYIQKTWTDMRPLSLRRHMEAMHQRQQQAASGEAPPQAQ
jgi:MbtH protein